MAQRPSRPRGKQLPIVPPARGKPSHFNAFFSGSFSPTSNPRHARRLARRLNQQAYLFYDLRRHVPRSAKAVDWNIQRMRDAVALTHLPAPAKRDFLNTLAHVSTNIHGLRLLSRSLHRGKITPRSLLVHLLADSSSDRALVQQLSTIDPRAFRVNVDWMGPHFVVAPQAYPLLEKIVQLEEGGFSGVSMRADHVELSAGGKDPAIHLSMLPFSISIEAADRSGVAAPDHEIIRHEKWHDFERLSRKIKDKVVMSSAKSYTPAGVLERISGWFQNELSATIYQQFSEIDSSFPQRIRNYFALIKRKVEDGRDTPNWTKSDWKKFRRFERKLLEITKTAHAEWQRIAQIDVDAAAHRVKSRHGKLTPSNPTLREQQIARLVYEDVQRKEQYNTLILSGLISSTPIDQIEERIRQFIEVNRQLNENLPYRRIATVE